MLSELEKEIMNLKLFEPYFKHYRTIKEYNDNCVSQSITDIINSMIKNSLVSSTQTREFFKVNLKDNIYLQVFN